MTTIEDKLLYIIAEALGIDKGCLSLQTKRQDVAAWDSFAHIKLFMAIEDDLEVKFASQEISQLDSIDKIYQTILLLKKRA